MNSCSSTSILALFLFSFNFFHLTLGDDSFDIRIPFDSSSGRKLLTSPSTNLQSFFFLSENFVTQDTQSYCGLASAVMVLNSFGDKISDPVDPIYKPYKYFTQSTFLELPCVQKVLGLQRYFIFMGMSLQQLADALQCVEKVKAEAVFFDEEMWRQNNNETATVVAMQRRMMKDMGDGKLVIANINRPGIDEIGGGHFSPIGAYYEFKPGQQDEKEEQNELGLFLFMDVSRYKYKPMWVNGKDLILAFKEKDFMFQRTRGFLSVSVVDGASQADLHGKSKAFLRASIADMRQNLNEK